MAVKMVTETERERERERERDLARAGGVVDRANILLSRLNNMHTVSACRRSLVPCTSLG